MQNEMPWTEKNILNKTSAQLRSANMEIYITKLDVCSVLGRGGNKCAYRQLELERKLIEIETIHFKAGMNKARANKKAIERKEASKMAGLIDIR